MDNTTVLNVYKKSCISKSASINQWTHHKQQQQHRTEGDEDIRLMVCAANQVIINLGNSPRFPYCLQNV